MIVRPFNRLSNYERFITVPVRALARKIETQPRHYCPVVARFSYTYTYRVHSSHRVNAVLGVQPSAASQLLRIVCAHIVRTSVRQETRALLRRQTSSNESASTPRPNTEYVTAQLRVAESSKNVRNVLHVLPSSAQMSRRCPTSSGENTVFRF